VIQLSTPQLWFVCGSQHLYGPGPLKQVAANAEKVAAGLAKSKSIPLPIVYKALVTTPDEITQLCRDADNDPNCAGLILWMHTFSPAKMWIRGLSSLKKPFCHLHTQFNRDLPWNEIDMDFMNLNQAAHGDREAGFLHTRLRLNRKVVVGHWSDPEVQQRLGAWARAARAWHDWQGAKFARFGDNMRYVAVTEGDKVATELRFGYSVNGYGVGDLVAKLNAVSDADISALCADYENPTTSPNPSAAAPPATTLSATPLARNSASAPFLRKETSRASPPPSKISTASTSSPASPANASWPTATASAPRAIGKPPRFSAR